MGTERGGREIPNWARQEREADLRWITENIPSFWPVAQLLFAAQGRGVIVVDTTVQPTPDVGHPMYYVPNDLAQETDDEDTKRMLGEYDPAREFVVLLLKDEEKAQNQTISRERVGVEHAIGDAKVYRIASDVFRNRREGFVDLSFETACGLHNLRCNYRLSRAA